MYEYKILEVVSIYDGDTMKVILDLGFGITSHQTLRLYGINAPELRGDSRDDGIISRDWLRDKVYAAMIDKSLKVKTTKDKKGKYGRLLAELFVDDLTVSLNKQMVLEGLALEYML